MQEPIKAEDPCEVIGGALGPGRSRNLGRIVIAVSSNGDELRLDGPDGLKNHGRIWRCRTKDGGPLVRIDGPMAGYVPPDQGDFAASWLRKLPPDPPKAGVRERELVQS